MANINTETFKFTSKVQALVAIIVVILVTEGCISGVAAAESCTTFTSALTPCFPAVQGENPPYPSEACCAMVRSADIGCLCNLAIGYSKVMSFNVPATLLLPKKCKHTVPAGSTCDGHLIPSYVPPHRKLMNAYTV